MTSLSSSSAARRESPQIEGGPVTQNMTLLSLIARTYETSPAFGSNDYEEEEGRFLAAAEVTSFPSLRQTQLLQARIQSILTEVRATVEEDLQDQEDDRRTMTS